MTQSTRIYKHSAAGTDWAALMLGAGLGLTLALQATTLRSGDFKDLSGNISIYWGQGSPFTSLDAQGNK
jgi:hypothetical protein